MAKINYRICDVCGEKRLSAIDLQFWLKIPLRARLYYGFPAVRMKRYDVCDECMAKITAEVLVQRKRRMEGKDIDEEKRSERD